MPNFKLFVFLLIIQSLTLACMPGDRSDTRTNAPANAARNHEAPRAEVVGNVTDGGANIDSAPARTVSKQECYEVETGDDVVMKQQTFPLDFGPFAGGCFVTTYNPEYDDPPMESHYAIYKNGKVALDLPEQFNGATFGCWVDAVAFQDINNDAAKDIIVVGKCSAKPQTYNENMVYINTGKTFVTRPDSNTQRSNFTKTKEIADFAEDNQQIFSK